MLKNFYWFVYWYSFSIFCLFTFRTFVFISKKLKNPIQSTAWKSKTNHLIWSVIYFKKELFHSNEFFQVLTFNWYGKKSRRIQENPRPVRQIFDFNRDLNLVNLNEWILFSLFFQKWLTRHLLIFGHTNWCRI